MFLDAPIHTIMNGFDIKTFSNEHVTYLLALSYTENWLKRFMNLDYKYFLKCPVDISGGQFACFSRKSVISPFSSDMCELPKALFKPRRMEG